MLVERRAIVHCLRRMYSAIGVTNKDVSFSSGALSKDTVLKGAVLTFLDAYPIPIQLAQYFPDD